jgi:hypothetical protein
MANRCLISILFLLFCGVQSVLFCQSFYVSTTGNNSNPGTEAQPWLTIQHACNSATPGSTVYIKQGTYPTVGLWMNVSGTAGNYITFTRFGSDVVVIDGGSTNTQVELLNIVDQSYLKIIGLQFRNAMGNYSKGVVIRGSSHHIEVSQNTIDNIHFSTNPSATVTSSKNANALLVYGDNATNTITDITLDGNIITNCRTGFSEALTVNGNVSSFEVKNNLIHDIKNIGIDIAGHFGACPDPALDQARNGKVYGNTVYNCRSSYAVSAAIYVDGGKDLVVERNTAYQSGRGFEIGCENVGKTTSNVILRNNFAYLNDQSGIGIGGYNYPSGSGKVINCTVRHNSLYGNATLGGGYGELLVEYTENCTIQNNIFSATSNRILTTVLNSMGLSLNYNLWYTTGSATTATVDYNGTIYTGFSTYKTATGQDANSLFANPNYVATNDLGNGVRNLHLQSNSSAINTGDPAFAAASGETDFDGDARIQSNRVDIGADEYSPTIPLELFFFSGNTEGGKNRLRWAVVDLKQVKTFELECNADGASRFETIQKITDGQSTVFEFIDTNPPTQAFYRLKMTDNEGKITYSKIIELHQKETEIAIFPNPTEGGIFLNGLNETASDISVFDISGKLVAVFKPQNRIDLGHLPAGLYQILMEQDHKTVQKTVLLQK